MTTESRRSGRYAAWIDRRSGLLLLASLVLTLCCAYLTLHLPVRADFANLLPPDKQSVRDLRAIQKRASAFGTVFLVVYDTNRETRAQATAALTARLRTLDPSLVANVTADDSAARQFFWHNRFLFVDLADLRDARDALKSSLNKARLDANPLYIDLEDDLDDGATGGEMDDDRIEALKKRFDDAERDAKSAKGFVSVKGSLQLIIIRSTFHASSIPKASIVMAGVERAIDETLAEFPTIRIGTSGDVATTLGEHRSIMKGMLIAAGITIFLVALGLLLYFRSGIAVGAVLWSLALGCLATFAITKLTIGYFNVATAFLAAIVIGNGINPNLILLARYLEERRGGNPGTTALGTAIGGALHGTLAASLTASVAYASLIVTDFRGFRHFGIIGGVGMALCWLTAFTVLPAALVRLERLGKIKLRNEPAIGPLLARLVPTRKVKSVVAGAALVSVLCGVATWRYVQSDYLEEDWRQLRSQSAEMRRARAWNHLVDIGFTESFTKGISNRFIVAVDRPEQSRALAAKLRGLDEGKAPDQRLLAFVSTVDDFLPTEQPDKLALLEEIHDLLDDDTVAELEPDDRATAERLRPPAQLVPLTLADIPEALGWPYVEKDGELGRLLLAASGDQYDAWNVRDLVRFADQMRTIELPDGAKVGGQSFVFADMVSAMEDDAPLATAVALLGSALVVFLIVGFRRHGVVTLVCAAIGTLGMVALVSVWGIKVNFLDFIALPITVGIGIDYAVNIVAREKLDGPKGPEYILSTTGGAVLMCSYTTIVGYGSLLLSDNAGIRSFGLAAILGEFTCLLAALIIAPAVLYMLRQRQTRGPNSAKAIS